MSINRVVLVGRLTRDPELKSTSSGMSVLNMRLAFNDRRKNSQTDQWEDVPNFIDVTVFGNRAEGLSRHLSKGSQIGVDGRLHWSEWESQSGEKRSKIEVYGDNIEFVGSRSDSGGESAPPSGGGGPTPSSGDDLEGEEIPF